MQVAINIFHRESVRSQRVEAKYMNLERNSQQTPQIEASQRLLGRALRKLLETCIPANRRHRRLFRAKYTEEINVASLEECLISAANKVIDLTISDRSLTIARPMAYRFMDTMARVQSLVSSVIDDYHKALTDVPLRCVASPFSNSRGIYERHERRNTEIYQPNHISSSQLSFFQDTSSPPGCTFTRSSSDPGSRELPTPAQTDSALMHLSSASAVDKRVTAVAEMKALDVPDLLELLIELDHDMATFEFALISSVSRHLRTEAEAEELQEVVVLMSETLMWALAVGLIDARKLANRDPNLLVSLPRLVVFAGCFLLPDSPIGPHRLNAGCRPPYMFAKSAMELTYLSRQLPVLRADQLWRLACWLSPFGLSDIEHELVNKASSAKTIKSSSSKLATSWKFATVSRNRLLSVDALKDTSRQNFAWNTFGLHCIYKCISSVSGTFSTNFPTEFRDILQMAIEMNDSSDENYMEGTDEDDELAIRVPVCPVTMASLEGSTSVEQQQQQQQQQYRQKQTDCIRGVSLKAVFDWHCMVFGGEEEKPKCDLLFEIRGPQPTAQQPPNDHSPLTSKLSTLEQCLSSASSLPVEEIGLDVVADLDEADVDDVDGTSKDEHKTPLSNESSSYSRSFLVPMLMNRSLIEGDVDAPLNSVYNLPIWQPDSPANLRHTASDEDADSVENADSDNDDDQERIGRWMRAHRRRKQSWLTASKVGCECAACKSRFNLVRRRHHCRRCGHIFCANCCNSWAPVESLGSLTPVRVCWQCAEFIQSGLAEVLQGSVICL